MQMVQTRELILASWKRSMYVLPRNSQGEAQVFVSLNFFTNVKLVLCLNKMLQCTLCLSLAFEFKPGADEWIHVL